MAADTICSDFGAHENKVSYWTPWTVWIRKKDMTYLLMLCKPGRGFENTLGCDNSSCRVLGCGRVLKNWYWQISQEAGQVVWYFYLSQNFPQFVVIHTVKGFGIVNKAEIYVFLELSCFSLGQSPGEGNGLPLQYSCLENSMDRRAWQATFQGIAKNWTRLRKQHFHFIKGTWEHVYTCGRSCWCMAKPIQYCKVISF